MWRASAPGGRCPTCRSPRHTAPHPRPRERGPTRTTAWCRRDASPRGQRLPPTIKRYPGAWATRMVKLRRTQLDPHFDTGLVGVGTLAAPAGDPGDLPVGIAFGQVL